MIETIKALADPTRLRLVGILAHGEFTVRDLISILRMGQSRISRHLKILVAAGVCTVQHRGTWSYYRLDGHDPFFLSIRQQVLDRIAALDGAREDQAGVARILDERRRNSQLFFDRHARQWDRLASDLIPVERYAEPIGREIGTGEIAVDVGVGTGRLLEWLAPAFRQVIGIDHSVAMLDEARTKVARNKLLNVELRLGEMSHLPVTDGVADAAVLNMVLHHAANPQSVLYELARILAPGGALVVADLAPHQLAWFRDRMGDQWMGFDEQEMERWLVAAGFRIESHRQLAIGDKVPPVFVMKAIKTTPEREDAGESANDE